MSELWRKINYTSYINCLIDTRIRVYDISKANISVLRTAGVISQNDYDYLYNAEKLVREVYVGKLQGNRPEVSTILKSGIADARKNFIEVNGITDNEILEINNDSLYIIGDRQISVQQISPYVYFRLDNQYTSFYKIKGIRFYYYANMVEGVEYLNPKGLGKDSRPLHEAYMLDFLKELFYTAQFRGVEEALRLLSTFYNDYISGKVDSHYYRRLDPGSHFDLINQSDRVRYQTDAVYYLNKAYIDKSYNESILRDLNKLLVEKYF